ncbi:MAG: hypothetical protein ACRD0P_35175, partial [Stackebrandtia sp.]
MPTSVLLAILAGAGLLALAPALVRRYDADERLAAELEESQARVLERKSPADRDPALGSSEADPDADPRPGETGSAADEGHTARPAMETGTEADAVPSAESRERHGAHEDASVPLSPAPTTKGRNEEVSVASPGLRAWWRKRYRRVLYVLLLLNLVELVGVIAVGPGFWFGVGVSLVLLLLFVRFLRTRVVRRTRPHRGTAAKPSRSKSIVADERQVYVPAQPETANEPEPA